MNRQLLIAGGVSLALGLLIGGLIGHFATPTEEGTIISTEQQAILDKYKALTTDQWLEGEKDGINDWIINEISTENLEKHLLFLSAEPHLAASDRDVELAEYIRDEFERVGFTWTEMVPSTFYLSEPNASNPNKIYIKDGEGAEVHTTRHREDFGTNNVTDFVDAFLAYTPAGDARPAAGEAVVYVNYGTVQDFEELANLGIDVTGRIAMMRYGAIYRGNKIKNAQDAGAIGAILFSDPEDVANEGQEAEDVYPNSWWLPETGMQRGSSFLGDGDPLTPGWPSTEHAYRITPEEAEFMTIPAQPIGYADAKVIFEMLGGDLVPSHWEGGLNLTRGYRLGPSFDTEFSNHTIELLTHNIQGSKESYNVFGTIEGAVEPDRYVLIGNHRDAWGYGASDPSSGTAQLLETARVLGDLLKTGWRPRRTLVFCSWGAEEYGLIGSTEWVEEHVDRLQGRAVAYINTDTCSTGPVLEAPASPLLWEMIKNVMMMVPGVKDSTKTVYDERVAFDDAFNENATSKPVMSTLGSGSDFAHFFIYAGVPAMDIWFRRDRTVHDISIYPSYHTGFETFEMVKEHNDPGFKFTQGCGRFASLTLKWLADALVLPFSVSSFPEAMKDSLNDLEVSGGRDIIMGIYDKYEFLEEAVANLTVTTAAFEVSIAGKEFDPVELRRVNDQLMKFEQSFLLAEGLPGRPVTRHAVFAPSQFDNYASAGFPGLNDLLYGYNDLTTEQKVERDEEIKRHVSDLTILTNRASSLLTDLYKF